MEEQEEAQPKQQSWMSGWTETLEKELSAEPSRRFAWSQVSDLLAQLRKKFLSYHCRNVFKPTARKYTAPDGRPMVRLYFLAVHPSFEFLGQTLCAVDYSPDDNEAPQDAGFVNLLDLANVSERFISAASFANPSLSKDEELMRERKRSYAYGLSDYDIEPLSGTVVFAYQKYICYFVDDCSRRASPKADEEQQEPMYCPTGIAADLTPLNLTICPHNPDLVAFVADRDVHCLRLSDGQLLRVTSYGADQQAALSAGLPPFVVQEEFDRFHGFWWRPCADAAGRHRLVFEVVDETDVEKVTISDPLKCGAEPDSYRYPRPGAKNAVSTLLSTIIVADESSLVAEAPSEVAAAGLWSSWEYVVRVAWTQDGAGLLVQLLNRTQDHLHLRLFPVAGSGYASVGLVDERSPSSWVEVHNVLHTFPQAAPNQLRWLWANERSGYRHLCLLTAVWHHPMETSGSEEEASAPAVQISSTQLTSGSWQVQPDPVAVDEQRQLVYFHSTSVDPRCVQLCCVDYERPGPVRVVTSGLMQDGAGRLPKTCTAGVFPAEGVALVTCQCAGHSYEVTLCRLPPAGQAPEAGDSQLRPLCRLVKPVPSGDFFIEPEFFEFQGDSSHRLYGLLFRPVNCQTGAQYPTLQYVYGGPHVQQVTNSFVGHLFHRVTKACYFGFCVVIVDNRGSENRGHEFVAEIRERLGSVELQDQVAGLQHAAAAYGCVDLKRVALFGWSYGGYLSLLGLRDYGHVYRLAIAGAPVTDWRLYDTAYTERYMGLPADCYDASSALTNAHRYPSEANRLLIAHGSIDENVHFYHTAQLLNVLNRACKPYSLLVYPGERHGLRNLSSKDHFDVSMMHFLCHNL